MLDVEEGKKLKLKAFFLKARRDAYYQLDHFSLHNSKQIRYEFSYKDLSNIMLGLNGIHALNHVTELLLEDETIKRKFSHKTLKREIENTLGEIILTEQERINEATSKSLDRLLMKLENTLYSNWTVVIPIVNVDLRIPSIQIGTVRIEICKHEMFLDFKKYLESNIDLRREMKNEFLSYTTRYIGKPIGICTIRAVDKEQAFEIANREIERALNILRFYGRGTMRNDVINYRMFIGRAGYAYKDQFIACYSSENESGQRDNFNFEFRFTGCLYPFVLDSEILERMNQLQFQRLSNILQKNEEDRTEFESRILQAIDFFGDGMNVYFDQTSAFIKFIISLELCLTDKWEPQKGLLAERVAIMITEDQQERLEVFEDINKLYQIRSDYVHLGSDQVTTLDFSLISYITFDILIQLISWTEKVKTLGELIAIFNETKFRCPVFDKDTHH